MERRHPSGRPSASTNDTLQHFGAYPSDNNDTPLMEYLEYPLVACGWIWLMGQNSNTNHNTSGFCSVALLWNLGELTHLTHWLRMAEALVP